MSVLDFISQGQAPPNATTTGSTQVSLPAWLNEYAMNTIARANQIASQPYTPYPGPRVAGFTSDQDKAFKLAKNHLGNWGPDLKRAEQNFNDPEVLKSYMNPYTSNVIDQAHNRAYQDYNQRLKPSLDNQFISSGQYGSSAHERAAHDMGNQLVENLHDSDLGALSQAYNQARSGFNTDMSRYGALAQARQSMGMNDVGVLSGIGLQKQQQNQRNLDTGYSDFMRQLNWPKEQLGWEQGIVSGIPHGQTTDTTGRGPASVYGPSPLNSILGTISTGIGAYKSLFPKGWGGGNDNGGFDYGTVDDQLNTPGVDFDQRFSYEPDHYDFGDPVSGYARGGLALAFRG